jgi:hypothetical protein
MAKERERQTVGKERELGWKHLQSERDKKEKKRHNEMNR